MHAWVLMGNHYHLVIETPEANLVAGMHWLQNAYTRRFNHRHRLWGHLFGGRYKAVIVEPPADGNGSYLCALLDYVHLNPFRAGLVKLGSGMCLLDYRWSSLAHGYAVAPSRRAPWLETATGFALRQVRDTVSGRKEFVRHLEERAADERGEYDLGSEMEGQTLNSTLERGWYWGTQVFREKLLDLAGKQRKKPVNRTYRSSPLAKAHGEFEAQRLLASGMAAMGLDAKSLQGTPGSDARKVALAKALHERTTMSQGWIAEQLSMRSAANVSQQVRRFSNRPAAEMPRIVCAWLQSLEKDQIGN